MVPIPPALQRAARVAHKLVPIHELLRPLYSGKGVIFALHRVVPDRGGPRIAANASLEVTPDFLEQVIDSVIEWGYEIISLDQLHQRLLNGTGRRFACFTFDDGYVDTYQNVYPIFRQRGLPFTVYITTSYIDKNMVLWHHMLETLLLEREEIQFSWGGRHQVFRAADANEKEMLNARLSAKIIGLSPAEYPRFVEALFERNDVCPEQFFDRTMSWEQVEALARDPLVTIGAHTVNHFNLARLPADKARWEIAESKCLLEDHIDGPVAHFAYPYGEPGSAGAREFRLAASCGFKTMTTMREGNIFTTHRNHLSCLPRIEIRGRHQELALLDLRLSGLLSILKNGLNPVVTV